jgi:hypothetical protein
MPDSLLLVVGLLVTGVVVAALVLIGTGEARDLEERTQK